MPDQATFRSRCQLERLANPQPFHPEDHAGRVRCHGQLAPSRAGNLLVHEPILKFHRRPHADGLKTVARTPMSQRDFTANPVRIEKFPPRSSGDSPHRNWPLKLPVKLNAVKICVPCPTPQFKFELSGLEFNRRLRPQFQPAGHVTGDGQTRADADKDARGTPEPFHQIEFRGNAGLDQLPLQDPPLNGDG